MKIGHYENKLLELGWVKKGSEDYSLIQTHNIESDLDRAQETVISKENFTLQIESGLVMPIGISHNAPSGTFRVLEKWENPYWKSANRFYYPSKQNPIGQYLIIMGDAKTNRKIRQGIHQWPDFEFNEGGFEQGPISNNGCIRANPSDMQKIFEKIKLGSLIYFIKN